MYIERDRYGTKFYPFDAADTRPHPASGYVEVCTEPHAEFKGKVRFNMQLGWLTIEQWAQLQAAMAEAFNLSGTVRQRIAGDEDADREPSDEETTEAEKMPALREYEPRCQCRHGLYSHYMCGSPQESRCLTGDGCKSFTPIG